MEIIITTAEELSRHPYQTIEPGTYHAPGRVLIVQPDDAAVLIMTEPHTEK